MNNSYQNLRMVPVTPLNHYLQKRYNDLQWVHRFGLDHIRFKGDFILFHAWKPGHMKLTWEQAEKVRRLIAGEDNEAGSLLSLPEEWLACESEVPDLEGILDKVIVPGLFELLSMKHLEESITSPDSIRLRAILEGIPDNLPIFPAIQNSYELRSFLQKVQVQKPKTIVEIGTAGGGVFYCLSQLADPEALLISIDYQGGPYGGGQDDNEVQLYSKFGGPKQHIAFIRDRSFHYSTKQDLKKILGGRQIDLLFIDGDHSYGGVLSDFSMYREIVAPGGIIAFHDINLKPETWGRGYDVRLFWDEVKKLYKNHQEIIDPNGCDAPIGLYKKEAPYAYGIGIIINIDL